jgi:colanic acid/amylovoran biosynthesis glycosyltransferase
MSSALAVRQPTAAPAAAQMPRIGYVLSLFPCYDETFILREIKALAERGVSLRIFSLRRRRDPVIQDDARPFLSETLYEPYMSLGVAIAALRALLTRPRELVGLLAWMVKGCWRNPVALAKSLAFLPKAIRFAERAREDGIEHLHAHWATYPATVALVMSRLTGITWSFTCHAHDIFHDPSLLPEKLERAEFALTCTADNKRYLETVSPHAARKVRVSYHGLDLRQFQPPAARPASDRVRILGVGSLLECKGFDILIEACSLLKQRGLAFHLTIAGGGPEEDRLRKAVADFGLSEQVVLTGYVTQKDLIPLYHEADIFALPAVLEIHWGIPNVLIEALACGVPVVTTALPSLPELVETGVHGLVARNKDPQDLADKLAWLVLDPKLRDAMGRAGRERVKRCFDVERTIETVLEPLVARSRWAS